MGQPAVSSAVVARLAAAAARDVPEVLDLYGGTLGEIATYGAQGPVRGVRVERAPTPRVRLYTVMRFGARLDDVADAVRGRVRADLAAQLPAFADVVVDVHVADVREADERQAGGASAHAPHEQPSVPRELP